MYFKLCLVRVKYFPENKYFPEMLFSGKENIFQYLVVFQNIFWKIFSGVWLYSWKCSKKTQFYHVSYIFLHFLSFQTNISSNPTKPKFSIPNKKKIHQIRDQPKIREQQNKNHPRHHNNNKKIRDQREQANRWRDWPRVSRSAIWRDDLGFDEWCDDFWVHDDRWRMGLTISGFATISDEWVWQFLGSRSKEWVRWRDLSLSLFARLSPSFSLSLSLSLGIARRTSLVLGFLGSLELLDVDRSRLRRCWGVGAISLPCCLSLSSIFLGWKWFEVKMRTEIIFLPSQPYFTVKLKTFTVGPNFQ